MKYENLGRYLFVSRNEQGLVGSIYYERGRMRLVHGHGPTVEILKDNEFVAYFILPNNLKYKEDAFKDYDFLRIYETIFTDRGRLLISTNYNLRNYIQRNVDPYCKGFVGFGGFNTACYLYEIYLENKNGRFVYNGNHPSRGFPYSVNIPDIANGCYQDIFYYATNKETHHSSTFYNLIVYGCFYGWYKSYVPFNIHSPYE